MVSVHEVLEAGLRSSGYSDIMDRFDLSTAGLKSLGGSLAGVWCTSERWTNEIRVFR